MLRAPKGQSNPIDIEEKAPNRGAFSVIMQA
jgi:hypothetical protein